MDSSLHRWRPVIANVSFLVLTVALLAGVVYLLKDFLHAIILGALLAGILLPVHHWILRRCAEASQWAHRAWRGLRRSPAPGEGPAEPSLRLRRMAACCSVALVFILVVVPLGVFAVQAADQGIRAIPVVQKWLREDLEGKTADFLDKHPRIREGLRKMTWGTGLLAEGGLLIIHALAKRQKTPAEPLLCRLFSLFFSAACAGFWEIYEFTADSLLGINMQGDNTNTMGDIIAGTLGALTWFLLQTAIQRRRKNT